MPARRGVPMQPWDDEDNMNRSPQESSHDLTHALARRHVRLGWWSLLCFLSLGIALEALHGLKVGWYLDVANDVRRLMWTLAHAHGTLLSLIHIAFGMSIAMFGDAKAWPRRLASSCLMGATILLPGGFFLGGVFFYDGDPGLGIFIVPVGAALLFVSVLLTARGMAPKERLAE